jgi:hypothetical protein
MSNVAWPIWTSGKPVPKEASGSESRGLKDYYTPQLRVQYQTLQQTESPRQQAIVAANISAANMELWKQIKKQYGIELINTVEARFKREEMEIIFNTLGEVPAEDLKGVTSIVKCISLGLEMELLHARANGKTVYGAYDKAHCRVFIFETCGLAELRKTVLHEIGHAVHSYKVSPAVVLKTARKAGWQLRQFGAGFLNGNPAYPVILKEFPVGAPEWEEAYASFSEHELRQKRTLDGRFELAAPQSHQNIPAFKNPLETFACAYERTYS